MRVVVVLVLAAVAIVGLPCKGVVRAQGMRQPAAAVSTPPFPLDDPNAIAEGAKRFSASCTGYCHGREGRVSRAPKLRGKTYDPNFLYARISNGSRRTDRSSHAVVPDHAAARRDLEDRRLHHVVV